MFERYTEKARRTIFFARYEASQFGSHYIETEHLLLGLLREDKALAQRFLGSHAADEAIRKQIEAYTVRGEKVPTSVDLPLSHECKRVLSYGAEEAEGLDHQHIGTEHLLLGLLREDKCFAAQLLVERGVTLESVRTQLKEPQAKPGVGDGGLPRLAEWLAEGEAGGGFCVVKEKRGAPRTVRYLLYAAGPEKEISGAAKIAQIQSRIDLAVAGMEGAIAHHEFEKARFYSEEERKERENLRLLRAELSLEGASPQAAFLCIEIIRHERFSEIQQRCDESLAAGVAEIWLLQPGLKRAYVVTKEDGLQEVKGGVLRIGNPPLEMDLRAIFELT